MVDTLKPKQLNLFENALQFYIEQNEIDEFQDFYVSIISNSKDYQEQQYYQQDESQQKETQLQCSEIEKNTNFEQGSILGDSRNRSAQTQIDNPFFNKSHINTSPYRKSHLSINSIKSYSTARGIKLPSQFDCQLLYQQIIGSIEKRYSSLYRINQGYNERFFQERRTQDFTTPRKINNINRPSQELIKKDKFSREISPLRSARDHNNKQKLISPYDSIWIERTLEKSYNIRIQFEQDKNIIQPGIRPRCRAFKITRHSKGQQNSNSKERKEDANNSSELYNQNQSSIQAKSQLISLLN